MGSQRANPPKLRASDEIQAERARDSVDWSLYGIVDKVWLKGRTVEAVTEALVRGGAGVIQYRDKVSETREMYHTATRIRMITERFGVPFIVNDRIDVALAVDANGVHVGQKDMPIDAVRRMIGRDKIIGISVSRLEAAEDLALADYVGVGALFKTDTKEDAETCDVDLVKRIRPRIRLPMIGIGGITLDRVESVIRAGCDGIAAVSGILGCEDIEQAARRFAECVRTAKNAKVIRSMA